MVSTRNAHLSVLSVSTVTPTLELALNVLLIVTNASVLLFVLNLHQDIISGKDNQYQIAHLKHLFKVIHVFNVTRLVKHAVGQPKQIAKAVHLKF